MGRKKIVLLPILFILSMCISIETVSAQVPYPSYAYGPEGEPFRIQTPYMPVKVIGNVLYTEDQSGQLTKSIGLSNPNDIYMDGGDHLFVADSNNNRIAKFNDEGILLQQFGRGDTQEAKLKAPEGVFVTDNGDVYVADTGNQRIVVYDADGRFLREYKKPDDVSMQNMMFSPVHVSVDSRGFLFVVLKGSNEGIAILSPEGEFQGFFGRNVTQLSLMERIKRKIYTEKQVATNANQEAASVSDLFIGDDQYIYTVTLNVPEGQIKKLNTKGINLFEDTNMTVRNADIEANGGLSMADIAVDDNGIIYTVDRNNGLVFVYDNDGQILASFGTKLTGNNYRIGSFGVPVSIAVDSKGQLYVVDQMYNGVHVFKPTTFMNKVLTATNMFNNGDYMKAKPYWEDILKQNTFYYKAHLGLGKIYYANQQWAASMAEMKIAKNQHLYSEARWQLRAAWIQEHLDQAAVVVVVFLIALIVIGRFKKRKLKAMKMRVSR